MYFVYIVENVKDKLYIGFTSDLEKRVKSHNNPLSKDWTKNKGPWNLIYKEEFVDKLGAQKRERYLKSLKAGQRIKKILKII